MSRGKRVDRRPTRDWQRRNHFDCQYLGVAKQPHHRRHPRQDHHGGNNASNGGGIWLYFANLTLTRDMVKDDIAAGGGGLDIASGSLTLNDTAITGATNGSAYGGLTEVGV